MKYRIGATTSPFPHLPLDENVRRMCEYGFDLIEIYGDHMTNLGRPELKKLLGRLRNLKDSQKIDYTVHAPIVNSFLSFPDVFENMPNPLRKISVDNVKKFIYISSYLGSKILTVHPFSSKFSLVDVNQILKEIGRNAYDVANFGDLILTHIDNLGREIIPKAVRTAAKEEFAKHFVKSLQEVQNLAREEGITICLENLVPFEVFSEPHLYEEIFEKFDPDIVSLTYDTAHAYIAGNLFDWLRFKKRLRHVHITDAGKNKLDTNPELGVGEVDFDKVIKGLRRIDYDGYLILENFDIEACVRSKDFLLNKL